MSACMGLIFKNYGLNTLKVPKMNMLFSFRLNVKLSGTASLQQFAI